jgi:hypothetical protein
MKEHTRKVFATLTLATALVAAGGASCDDDSDSPDTAGKGGQAGARSGSGGTPSTGGNGGQPGTGGTAGASAGGAGNSGVGGQSGGAGSGGSATGACGGFVTDVNDPCDACIQEKCCDQGKACAKPGAACEVCDYDPFGAECRQGQERFAFRKCRAQNCADACKIRDVKVDVTPAPSGKQFDVSCGENQIFGCNPVKREKCPGELPDGTPFTNGVCDQSGSFDNPVGLNFFCYGPPQTQTLGQFCGSDNKFCSEGLDCYDWTDTCAKYCCSDSDCSEGARCAKNAIVLQGKGLVGVCLMKDTL